MLWMRDCPWINTGEVDCTFGQACACVSGQRPAHAISNQKFSNTSHLPAANIRYICTIVPTPSAANLSHVTSVPCDGTPVSSPAALPVGRGVPQVP